MRGGVYAGLVRAVSLKSPIGGPGSCGRDPESSPEIPPRRRPMALHSPGTRHRCGQNRLGGLALASAL